MLLENLTKRRSIHHINSHLPVSEKQIIDTIQQCVLHCPTAFNAQSARVAVLFNTAHNLFWKSVDTALSAVLASEIAVKARLRLNNYAQGYGTVLFFDDTNVLEQLKHQYPDYAESMFTWFEQANGMLQYMIWQALAEQNVGASLQHYGNLVEKRVLTDFSLPPSWRLIAQMPFGGIVQPAQPKTFTPLESRVVIRR